MTGCVSLHSSLPHENVEVKSDIHSDTHTVSASLCHSSTSPPPLIRACSHYTAPQQAVFTLYHMAFTLTPSTELPTSLFSSDNLHFRDNGDRDDDGVDRGRGEALAASCAQARVDIWRTPTSFSSGCRSSPLLGSGAGTDTDGSSCSSSIWNSSSHSNTSWNALATPPGTGASERE